MAKSAGIEDVSVLAGSLTSGQYSAAFTPNAGNDVNLSLYGSGSWTGTVSLFRSFDRGTTMEACTSAGTAISWTGNISEPVWNEPELGVLLYLYFSGTGSPTFRFGERCE
jgi:hypothetical protein